MTRPAILVLSRCRRAAPKRTRRSEQPGQSLDQTIRSDGRFATTPGFVHHLMGSTPKLAYDPKRDIASQRAWRCAVKRKLRQLLAFPRTTRQEPPIKIAEAKRDGYRMQTWELYPEPDCTVPFLMLIPDQAAAKSPTVLCFPGSDHPKEALCGELDAWDNKFAERNRMALHLVKKGLLCVVLDNPGTASLADPQYKHWHRNSLQLLWLGRSYEGLSVFQKFVLLQWLKRQPFVDRKRIATCGHSLGAKPALLLGLLDPDIRAVVWNDMVANWRHREYATNLNSTIAPWHYVPGFAQWFDYIDLMAALAPTPLLVTEGGLAEDHRIIRSAYKQADAPDSFTLSFMPNFRETTARFTGKLPTGVEPEDFPRYANYDQDHYFKDDVAVPWLCKQFETNANVVRRRRTRTTGAQRAPSTTAVTVPKEQGKHARNTGPFRGLPKS